MTVRMRWYRKSRAPDQTALHLRIREFAPARLRFGVLRIWVSLRGELPRYEAWGGGTPEQAETAPNLDNRLDNLTTHKPQYIQLIFF